MIGIKVRHGGEKRPLRAQLFLFLAALMAMTACRHERGIALLVRRKEWLTLAHAYRPFAAVKRV